MAGPRRALAGSPANWVLNLALVALLVAAWFAVRALPPVPGPRPVHWWLLAPAFYIAQLAVVRVHLRSEAFAFSLREAPLVVGVLAAPPADVVFAQLAASVAVSVYNRRLPAVRLIFEAGRSSLQAALTVLVFGALNPPDPLAAGAALLVCAVVAAGSVAGDLLSGFRTPHLTALTSLTTTSLTIAAYGFTLAHPADAWLLAIPVAAGFIAYRAYIAGSRERDRIGRLYETGRALQSAGGTEAAIATVLRHARATFKATFAEIQLVVEEGDVLVATLAADAPSPSFTRISPGDARAVTDQVLRPARVVQAVLGRGELERRLRRRGLRSAMLTPLGREGAVGMLLVGNPERPQPGFHPGSLPLLQAFAAQAGIAFEKDRLQEQFRHLAFHDPLTKLANRALLADRTDQALRRARRSDTGPAMLLLDLDDFKAVNDSLGHAAGDRLLLEVADRLRACIRPHDTGARLGGDEFAILVEDAHSAAEAVAVAERVVTAMDRPFEVEGRELRARASVGIALAEPGLTGEELMRRADLALYRAKGEGKGRWMLFEAAMRAGSADGDDGQRVGLPARLAP